MIRLICKFKNKFLVPGFFIIVYASTVCANSRENKVNQYQKVQHFLLSSRIAQEDRPIRSGTKVIHMGANVAQLVKGRLNWIRQDPNGFAVIVEVLQIDYEFPNPQPEDPARITKIKPFTASATLSKENEVPISIQITEGGIKDNSLGLSEQYKTVYLVLDMMCATVMEKEFVISKDGWGANLNVTYPNNVKIDEYGVLPVSRLKNSLSPAKFTVLPRMSYKGIEETQLFTFTHGGLNIYLFSRLIDNKTGFSTHAVNLEATSKVEMKDKDYLEMITQLNMPHELERFLLFELKVTTVE